MPTDKQEQFEYVGNELELFAHATTWKFYFTGHIAPYIQGRVLEVGAGIGGTTRFLCVGKFFDSWLCLEPDEDLASEIARKIEAGELPSRCELRTGTLKDLEAGRTFDTILYIDVLEHIEDDREEMERASRFLAEGGRLVVVSPAHNWLYSPFDKAIGHFRRYNRRMLLAAAPEGLRCEACDYLDSAGLFASLANRLLLRQRDVKPSQIRVWNRVLVPVSRVIDPVLRYNFGKEIIGVWQRPHSEIGEKMKSVTQILQ